MHSFCELIERSTSFTLHSLEQAESEVIKKLQKSSATVHIKQLQMLQLQRSIFTVGMFSIFEAHLQNELSCQNGFKEVRIILDNAGKPELKERFDDYYRAINALKHGDGASYRQLVDKISDLEFDVETPRPPVYKEGDVSAIRSLIKTDDAFILDCAALIRDISETLSEQRPDFSKVAVGDREAMKERAAPVIREADDCRGVHVEGLSGLQHQTHESGSSGAESVVQLDSADGQRHAGAYVFQQPTE